MARRAVWRIKLRSWCQPVQGAKRQERVDISDEALFTTRPDGTYLIAIIAWSEIEMKWTSIPFMLDIGYCDQSTCLGIADCLNVEQSLTQFDHRRQTWNSERGRSHERSRSPQSKTVWLQIGSNIRKTLNEFLTCVLSVTIVSWSLYLNYLILKPVWHIFVTYTCWGQRSENRVASPGCIRVGISLDHQLYRLYGMAVAIWECYNTILYSVIPCLWKANNRNINKQKGWPGYSSIILNLTICNDIISWMFCVAYRPYDIRNEKRVYVWTREGPIQCHRSGRWM